MRDLFRPLRKIPAELKRRSVFRVAFSYAVAGWIIIQVSDVVFPALKVPEWGVTLVILLVASGFPISLLLAWFFDLTPEGFRRERGRRDRSDGSPPEGSVQEEPRASGPYSIHNLPPEPTRFVGRTSEMRRLRELLADPSCRLITLTGPGGTGKSRLALHLAAQISDRFPSGVCYVPLSSVSTADLLAATIAERLGIVAPTREDPRLHLLRFLREKELLLLLDNFEHLLAGGTLVSDILEQAPHVRILVTSRERLHLHAEVAFPLGGIELRAPPDSDTKKIEAVELFIEGVTRNDPRTLLEPKDLDEILRICRAVDGLPLAIELASAWTGTLSLNEIADQILSKQDFLFGAPRDFPERHRSLRAVFESSWRLLPDPERTAFARLSVFRGGFTREAAERVAAASLPILSSLIGKSLVRKTHTEKYEVHELLRQYAEERLRESPREHEWALQLHAEHYAQTLAALAGRLEAREDTDALQQVRSEIDNVRAAWRWTVEQRRFDAIERCIDALFAFYNSSGWAREGEEMFRVAAAAARSDSTSGPTTRDILARLILREGFFGSHLGHYDRARDLLEEALAHFRASGDDAEAALALDSLGVIAASRGAYPEATHHHEESLSISRRLGDQRGIAKSSFHLGNIAFALGNSEQARELWSAGLAIFKSIGDRVGVSFSLKNLGGIAVGRADYAEARRLQQESLRIDRDLDNRLGVAYSLQHLGYICLQAGETREAERHLQEGVELCRTMGFRRLEAFCLSALGSVHVAAEQYEQAERFYLEALAVSTDIAETPLALEALLGLASLLARGDQRARAAELLSVVVRHPASNQDTRDRAMRTVRELDPAFEPDRASPPETADRDLARAVAELLAGGPAPLVPSPRG